MLKLDLAKLEDFHSEGFITGFLFVCLILETKFAKTRPKTNYSRANFIQKGKGKVQRKLQLELSDMCFP
jgi:hypothetical protein